MFQTETSMKRLTMSRRYADAGIMNVEVLEDESGADQWTDEEPSRAHGE